MSVHVFAQIVKTHLRHPFNRIYYGILFLALLYWAHVEHEISKLEKELGKIPSFGSWVLPEISGNSVDDCCAFNETIFQSGSEVELTFPKSKVRKLRQRGQKCYETLSEKNLKSRIDLDDYKRWIKGGKGEHPDFSEIQANLVDNSIEHGCWVPDDCVSDQFLAVIVPCRDRISNLKTFLFFMHSLLQKQKRTYCIILSEQSDMGQFNRAKLMNAGYLEALKHPFFREIRAINSDRTDKLRNQGPNCFSFHDVDLIPESERNLFACIPDKAIHQCDKYDKYGYETQYASGLFTAGGAILIHKSQYEYMSGPELESP